MIKLKDLSVKNKMMVLIGIFMVGFVALGVLAYNTVSLVKVGGPIESELSDVREFQSDVEPPQLYIMEVAYDTNRLYAFVQDGNTAKVTERIERIKKGIDAYHEAHAAWEKRNVDAKLKDLAVAKASKPAEEYIKTLQTEVIPAAQSGDAKKIWELLNGTLSDTYAAHRKFLEETNQLTADKLKDLEGQAATTVASRTTTLIVVSLAIMALVIFVGWMIIRSLVGPLAQVVEKLKMIATGDVNQTLDYQSKDEIGSLADAFRALMEYLKDVARTIDYMSRGDLSHDITARSPQDSVNNSLKQAVEALQGLNSETQTLIDAAQSGKLEERGNTSKFKGAYAEIVDGINQMMEAVATPLNEASDCLQRVARRDLTAQMTGDYKGDFATIKEALNTALANLDEGMQQIAMGAEQVTSAATEISSGSQSLAQGASEQASTLEEISSNLQEISSMTKQNASNSKEARSMSDSARVATDGGMRNMKRLSEAVEKIKDSSDSTAKIVKTIEEIAFQTNLLALNAAVEAARAGDAGKGFAVVAEEVRNLAMRSAEAAQTTAHLIDEAVKNTESGVSLNAEVSQNLEEINAQIEKVSVVMAEIAAASEQQNQGVEQINVAVEQMNGVTQQTAANSEESASAAEELSGQSQEMLGLVNGYKLSNERAARRPNTASFTQKPATVGAGTVKTSYAKKTGRKKETNGFGQMPAGDSLIPFGDMDDSVLREF